MTFFPLCNLMSLCLNKSSFKYNYGEFSSLQPLSDPDRGLEKISDSYAESLGGITALIIALGCKFSTIVFTKNWYKHALHLWIFQTINLSSIPDRPDTKNSLGYGRRNIEMIQFDINNRSQICDQSVQFGLKKISDYATAGRFVICCRRKVARECKCLYFYEPCSFWFDLVVHVLLKMWYLHVSSVPDYLIFTCAVHYWLRYYYKNF